MEISGRVLREVEFRDRLRGYDTDEVDEFLEKVALAVDEMQAELERLSRREAPAPPPANDIPVFDDESIRRTLVLAQRTADLAISEAREEADRLLGDARVQAESLLAQAYESVRRLRSDAEQELHDRVSRLEGDHERLGREAAALASLLDSERTRLVEGLTAALRWVDETLAVPEELGRATGARPGPAWPADEHSPSAKRTTGRHTTDVSEPETVVVASGDGAPTGVSEGADNDQAATDLAPDEPHTASHALPDVEAEITEDAATAAQSDAPAQSAPPALRGLSNVRALPAQATTPSASTPPARSGRSSPTRAVSAAPTRPVSAAPTRPVSSTPARPVSATPARPVSRPELTPTPPLDADDALWARWASGSAGMEAPTSDGGGSGASSTFDSDSRGGQPA